MNIQITSHTARVPVTVFHVEGRIHLGNAHELREKAQAEYDQGMRNMILNMADIQSLTSEGLRVIHFIYTLLRDSVEPERGKSAHLKLLNPQADIRRTLNVAGFDTFLDIFDTLPEALASFK